MPFSSYADAEDAMLTQFKTAWDAIDGGPPVTIYDDSLQNPPDGSEYVRVYIRNNLSQATVIGNTRFRHHGMFFIEIYTNPGNGKSRNQFLGIAALHAFQGKNSAPDGVWYRNVSYKEKGQDGEYFKGWVQGDFIWDEALPRPNLP